MRAFLDFREASTMDFFSAQPSAPGALAASAVFPQKGINKKRPVGSCKPGAFRCFGETSLKIEWVNKERQVLRCGAMEHGYPPHEKRYFDRQF
jgi:hypothetical protein